MLWSVGQRPASIGPFAQAVNAELRAQMARRGMRQQDIEDRTGIPQGTVSNFLRGRSALTVHNLRLICDALEVAPVDIVAAAERAVTRSEYRLAAKTPAPDVDEQDYL